MATVTFQEIPIGSQFYDTKSGLPEDANDFEVRLTFSENVSNLQRHSVVVDKGIVTNIVGNAASYQVTVRPLGPSGPGYSHLLTITLMANAVDEGNPETSKQIRISSRFPDDDAEIPTPLFSNTGDDAESIDVMPTGILVGIKTNRHYDNDPNPLYDAEAIFYHDFNGSNVYRLPNSEPIHEYFKRFNGAFIGRRKLTYLSDNKEILQFPPDFADNTTRIYPTQKGFFTSAYISSEAVIKYMLLPYGKKHKDDIVQITHAGLPGPRYKKVVYQQMSRYPRHIRHALLDSLIYTYTIVFTRYSHGSHRFEQHIFTLQRWTDDTSIENVRSLNIKISPVSSYGFSDIAIYRDKLYLLGNGINVSTVDIGKYRPMAMNVKKYIPTQFAKHGDRLDLTRFAPGAERFTLVIGSKTIPGVSITQDNKLTFGREGAWLIRLTAINRIDAVDIEVPVVVRRASAPETKPPKNVAMLPNTTMNLFLIAPEAETISFQTGKNQPTGSRIKNGRFQIGTQGGTAYFTATRDGQNAHFQMNIDVAQLAKFPLLPSPQKYYAETGSEFTGHFRYRVEIEGIDVSADLLEAPDVSESLDPVALNEYRVNEANLTLKNEDGKYNDTTIGNFWTPKIMNPGGFQNRVKIYVEREKHDGTDSTTTLFSGTIVESFEPLRGATFRLNCVDATAALRSAAIRDFGTRRKWTPMQTDYTDAHHPQGQRMLPEESLAPMLPATLKAFKEGDELNISLLPLSIAGPIPKNTGYAAQTALMVAQHDTERGPYGTSPHPGISATFKNFPMNAPIKDIAEATAAQHIFHNVHWDIPPQNAPTPFWQNRGSIARHTENTRATRIPVDWVHDPSGNRILILMSDPVFDTPSQIVQFDIETGRYKTAYRCPEGITAHRIARAGPNDYYILACSPVHPMSSSGDAQLAYDSIAHHSDIQIWRFNENQKRMTTHVRSNSAHRPQLGVHYWVGFGNAQNVFETEGIRPEYRGAFQWRAGHLYYRYATKNEFGIARVNPSGRTQSLIKMTHAVGPSFASYDTPTHLNFAFDIDTATGDIYFAYSTADANTTQLIIKKRDTSGTTHTILQDSRTHGNIESPGYHDFWGFLGVLEARYHKEYLYLLAPVLRSKNVLITGRLTPTITATYSGTGEVLNVTGASASLSPGEDIRVRLGIGIEYPDTRSAKNSDFFITGGYIDRLSEDTYDTDYYSPDNIHMLRSLTMYIKPANPTAHQDISIRVPRDTAGWGNKQVDILIKFPGVTLPAKEIPAAMVLYRCPVNSQTPRLEPLETYPSVKNGACNLTVHDDAVHFGGLPIAAEVHRTNAERRSDRPRDESLPIGTLKRIRSDGTVETHGNLWWTQQSFNISATRGLSVNGELHMCLGYGNPEDILEYNAPAAANDNFSHFVLSNRHYHLLREPRIEQSVYAILADIAKKVNATVSFEKDIIRIADRRPHIAFCNGDTGTGNTNIKFADANRPPFPSSGYLLLGSQEILMYRSLTGNAFAGVVRGVLGTPRLNHADGTEIIYLDRLLNPDDSLQITTQSDTNRLYNIIRDSTGTEELRDEDSIAKYGERPYTLDLGLTRQDAAWIGSVFQSYLQELKDLQKLVNIQIPPDVDIAIGQVVPFFYEHILLAMRIITCRYTATATHILGRTIAKAKPANLKITTTVTAPDAPRNLAVSYTGTMVSLSWGVPISDGGAAISKYEFRYRKQGGSWSPWATTTGSTGHSHIVSLAVGSYDYQVRASNSAGAGPFSNTASVTITPQDTPPGVPTSVTATPGDVRITVSWSPPASDGGQPITGYRVRLDSGGWVTKGASATSHLFTGLTSSTSYTVSVQAQNAIGFSASGTATATTPAPWTSTWQTLTGVRATSGNKVNRKETRTKTSGGGSGRGVLTAYTLTTLRSVKGIQIHVSTGTERQFLSALSLTKKLRIYDTEEKWVEYAIVAFRGGTVTTGKTWWINVNYEKDSGTWTETNPSTLNFGVK